MFRPGLLEPVESAGLAPCEDLSGRKCPNHARHWAGALGPSRDMSGGRRPRRNLHESRRSARTPWPWLLASSPELLAPAAEEGVTGNDRSRTATAKVFRPGLSKGSGRSPLSGLGRRFRILGAANPFGEPLPPAPREMMALRAKSGIVRVSPKHGDHLLGLGRKTPASDSSSSRLGRPISSGVQ